MTPTLQPLPPKEAIAYFRQKGLTSSFAWQDVWQEEHAKAFTVAKMASRDLLEETRRLLDEAISNGTTFETFKKELVPTLKAAGWWGKQKMVDPSTGEARLVQLGSDRRLRTIFDVNLRTSYMQGNWQRAQATKGAFPYLMYNAIRDNRTRPQHRAWDGVCLPIDDPWWDTHYPPCGWRCRCGTISFTRRMAEKHGITLEPPKFPPKTYVNPRTGEVTIVETGIDPGWSYNVGKAPLRALTPKAPVSGGDKAAIKTASEGFLKPLRAHEKPRIISDADGWPIVVGPDMFLDAAGAAATPRPDLIADLPLIGRALAKPGKAEWIMRVSGRGAGINDTPEAMADLVDHALADKSVQSRLLTGPAPSWLSDAGRASGIDIHDFSRGIDGDAVRHMIAQHGDAARELARGQIAITGADIARIPKIADRADFIAFGRPSKLGHATISYATRLDDGVYIYVEEIRRRRWELMAKTLYKFPATADAKRLLASASLNARNDDEAVSKILEIGKKINDAKAQTLLERGGARVQLVRRYTTALDNRLITIDFTGTTWTYDVTAADVSN
jgi:SPP1 gp7 family putative phage head morphogenesis protein